MSIMHYDIQTFEQTLHFVNYKGLWQWYSTLRITGFLHFAHYITDGRVYIVLRHDICLRKFSELT